MTPIIFKKIICLLFGHNWVIKTQLHTCDGDYSTFDWECTKCKFRKLETRYNR
jgi:hypothetical protein